MPLIASIQYVNNHPIGTQITGRVYINLIDAATGHPANGNNVTVTYQIKYNDIITGQVINIPGQSKLIYDGLLEDNDPAHRVITYFSVTGIGEVPDELPGDGVITGTELQINSITINAAASAPGAADAQITVNATATYLPMAYKLNGVLTQASNIFTGLAGGSHTLMVIDDNGESVSQTVFIPTVNNLLAADPSVRCRGAMFRGGARPLTP